MDPSTVGSLIKLFAAIDPNLLFWLLTLLIVTPLGVVILVLWFQFSTERRNTEILRTYRDDMTKQQHLMEIRVDEVRKMYEANVELVRVTQKLANDQKDVLLLVAQTMQRVCDEIRGNQFCPLVRLKKDVVGVVEEG